MTIDELIDANDPEAAMSALERAATVAGARALMTSPLAVAEKWAAVAEAAKNALDYMAEMSNNSKPESEQPHVSHN